MKFSVNAQNLLIIQFYDGMQIKSTNNAVFSGFFGYCTLPENAL